MNTKFFVPLGFASLLLSFAIYFVGCGNQGPSFTEEVGKIQGSANAEVSDTPIVINPENNGDSEGVDQEVIDEAVAHVDTSNTDEEPEEDPIEEPIVTDPGVGTGGTGETDPTFYKCDTNNPDSRAIFVKAYDIASYEQAINADFEANIIDLGGGVLDFNNLKFIKEKFNDSQALSQSNFLTSFCMLNFAVSPRRFEDGFPNSGNSGEILPIIEWFALDAIADLEVPSDGIYQLQIQSDDGSIVYLDGNNVLDNDGRHHPITKQSSHINLTKGKHRLVVHYFQGPRYQIALELYWKKPGDANFAIIPPNAFKFVGP